MTTFPPACVAARSAFRYEGRTAIKACASMRFHSSLPTRVLGLLKPGPKYDTFRCRPSFFAIESGDGD
jgi:hypothetical protein